MPHSLVFNIGLALTLFVILWSYWMERRVTRAKPPAGEMIKTSRGMMHVIRRGGSGEAAKTPIVLIHGSTTNALDMEMDMASRLEAERDVFIPDRPGHGFSDRSEDGWRLDVQAAQIHEALREAGIEKPIVLGQSYGGAVALRYALDYPQDISGLVLVAAVTHPWPGGVSWYNRVGINPLYGWLFRRTFIALYGRYGSPRGVARALRGSKNANRYFTRTRVPLTFRPRHFLYNNEDIVRLYEQLFAMADRYDELDLPIEAVAGTHDMTVMTSIHARSLDSQIGGLNLEVIDGGGHALHHTHPDEVMEAIHRLDTRLANQGRSPLQGALRRLTSVFPGA
ncbi:alpha/beta fold hydrolase [Parvularcula marina]|uniref:alpha/beta fold hydrolase n=1 Tax=Parvularcula marina TaxID=2292771 RepID=UPI0035192DEE